MIRSKRTSGRGRITTSKRGRRNYGGAGGGGQSEASQARDMARGAEEASLILSNF